MTDDLWQAMLDMMARLRDVPPRAYVMAHHSVPYGRVYRQWDTDGHLLIWVNRGLVADLPRQKIGVHDYFLSGTYGGIPVINA